MVRKSKKNNKDIAEMPCICGKDGNIKMSVEEKTKLWKEYKEKPLNEENELSGKLNVKQNEGPCEKVVGKSSCGSTESDESRKSSRTK